MLLRAWLYVPVIGCIIVHSSMEILIVLEAVLTAHIAMDNCYTFHC